MVFLTDMQADTNNPLVWDNGKVLDPKNGKVYDAKMTLINNGNNLVLRGYIGISLLGRSQTWNHISNEQLATLIGTVGKKNLGGYFVTSTGLYVAPGYDSCAQVQTEVDAMTNQSANNSNNSTPNSTTSNA